MLTAADVEQKTFSTALRGYDLDEVDDFLDEVVATIRDLNEQLEAAKATVGSKPEDPVDNEPTPAPEPAVEAPTETEPAPPPPALDESAVGRALIAAQTAADKLLEEAQSEATRIVDDAQTEADTWETAKQEKKAEAEAEMARIAARVATVRSELSVLADEVSVKLDDMDAALVDDGVGADANETVVGEPLFGDEGEADHPTEAVVADGDDGVDESDPLDEILNGVATDLQMGNNGDDDQAEGSDSTEDADHTESDEDHPDD